MPCCKSKDFKWCKDLKIVHTDEEGKEYCVFHAPKGEKGVATVAEFNELVFQRIQEANEADKECDLSGAILEGDISFDHYNIINPLPDVVFRGATFSKEASFKSTTFNGKASFIATTFNGKADFTIITFNEEADFYGTTFNEEASFGKTFTGRADFGTIFNGKADFYYTTFNGKADFCGTTFNEEADFIGTTFEEGARFLA